MDVLCNLLNLQDAMMTNSSLYLTYMVVLVSAASKYNRLLGYLMLKFFL